MVAVPIFLITKGKRRSIVTINEFMQNNIPAIRNEIITQLDNSFTSHQFIEKFAKRFEEYYIEFLHGYRTNESFRIVHSQIAKYLSEHQSEFNISKDSKEVDQNVFGEFNENQKWEKDA